MSRRIEFFFDFRSPYSYLAYSQLPQSFTGNNSALHGKANFAGFAPTKAAQRILAKSLAPDLGPKGVHVAYLLIDAVIDVPWQRQRLPDAPADFFIQPAAIASEVFHLAHEPREAWSSLAEVRPFHEPW